MKIDHEPKYDFDEVFIKPMYSNIQSRKDVNISQTLWGKKVHVPIVSANMDTVTDGEFAATVTKAGGIGAIHRYLSLEENVEEFLKFKNKSHGKMCFCSLGTNVEVELERFVKLHEAGASWFIIDIAHGASQNTMNMVNALKEHLKKTKKEKDFKLVVGNFATPEALEHFLDSEDISSFIDGYKIGIGPGFVCTTKNVTGVTVPQFSAVLDCAKKIRHCDEWDGKKRIIIADGGIREIGDIAKAIGAGADLVMSGKLFAECSESIAGRRVIFEGEKAVYRGMASRSAMLDFHGKMSSTPEGREELIDATKTTETLLREIEGGLRSAFSYANAKNLHTFQMVCSFGVRKSKRQ